MKVVTRTSKEYKAIKAKEIRDSTCPECGEVSLFNSYSYEYVGSLFKVKTVRVDSYSCCNCGCQWEIR